MENNDTIFSEINNEEKPASPFQAFLTGIIDFAIDILIIFLVYKFLPWQQVIIETGLNSLTILIIIILVATLYRLLFLVFFNKTIGMMITGVKFLNGELKPLSTKEKLMSVFRTRFSKIKYYKGR